MYLTNFTQNVKTPTTSPVPIYPNLNEPFATTGNTSCFAISHVLSQGSIGSDLPIAFASRTL